VFRLILYLKFHPCSFMAASPDWILVTGGAGYIGSHTVVGETSDTCPVAALSLSSAVYSQNFLCAALRSQFLII